MKSKLKLKTDEHKKSEKWSESNVKLHIYIVTRIYHLFITQHSDVSYDMTYMYLYDNKNVL